MKLNFLKTNGLIFVAILPQLGVLVLSLLSLSRLKKYKFKRVDFILSTPALFLLLVFFCSIGEYFILKYLMLIPVAIIMKNYLFDEERSISSLLSAINFIFFFNISVIGTSVLIPQIGQIFSSDEYVGRYAGFFGFDFVGFFFSFYCITIFHSLRKTFTSRLLLILIISGSACLLSGRFSVLIFLVALTYLILSTDRKALFVFILSAAIIFLMIVFEDRVQFVILSVVNMFKYLFQITSLVGFCEGQFREGFYACSYLTWFAQISSVEILSYDSIFPNEKFVELDAGPFFILENFGIILGPIVYLFFFKIFYSKGTPFIFLVLFLLVDLKYRTVFAIFPSFWFLLCSSFIIAFERKQRNRQD